MNVCVLLSVSQQCFTTLLFSHLCILSEVSIVSDYRGSIVLIVASVIVSAIGIAGLAAVFFLHLMHTQHETVAMPAASPAIPMAVTITEAMMPTMLTSESMQR